MIAIATFDLEITEQKQPVYIHGSAIVRHLQHLCVHGRDYLRVTYEYEHGDDMHEHAFVLLSDRAQCDIPGLVFVGSVLANESALLLYKQFVPASVPHIESTGNISFSQSIHHITIT